MFILIILQVGLDENVPAIRHDILDFCERELDTFGKGRERTWQQWMSASAKSLYLNLFNLLTAPHQRQDGRSD